VLNPQEVIIATSLPIGLNLRRKAITLWNLKEIT
jgi:hypothetical protein